MTARPAKRALTEAQLHRQVAEYLAVALQPPTVWTTFPAGGGGKARGGQLKARGLRPGWPDIQVIHYRPGFWSGLFIGIELKTIRGECSKEQIACHAAIRAAGGAVFLCRSVADVQWALCDAGVPLRAWLMAGGGSTKVAV